jgi:tripartite-type tricarboxylate transporter receptor subunit TctC
MFGCEKAPRHKKARMPQPQSTTRRCFCAGSATLLSARASSAQGSGWPTKPVSIMVPCLRGVGTGAFARPLFVLTAKNTGRRFIIDSKGGAGGTLSASLAAKAAPDGCDPLMGTVHHAIAPSTHPKLG